MKGCFLWGTYIKWKKKKALLIIMSWWKFWWKIYWPLIQKHFVVSLFDLLCTCWLTFTHFVHLYIVERGVKLLSHLPSMGLSHPSPLLNILFAPDGCEGGDGLTDHRGPTGLYSPCSSAKPQPLSPQLGCVVTAKCKTLQPFPLGPLWQPRCVCWAVPRLREN